MIYFRGNRVYNTTFFPWSNLVYYLCMNALGHMYVNTANLNFERKHLLHSNHRHNRDFYMALLIAPVLFLLSSIMILRSPFSITSS
jgi:hypothetical protein